MNDLAKMRDEFELKLRLAEKENEMEEKYSAEFSVLDYDRKTSMRIYPTGICSLELAKKLLNNFPAQKEIELDSTAVESAKTFHTYKLYLRRGYSDRFSQMDIEWNCEGDRYEVHLQIDGDERLEQFFNKTSRTVTSTEVEVYHPMYADGRLNYNAKIPKMSFKCKHMTYYGGYESATDIEEIDRIVNFIKNL